MKSESFENTPEFAASNMQAYGIRHAVTVMDSVLGVPFFEVVDHLETLDLCKTLQSRTAQEEWFQNFSECATLINRIMNLEAPWAQDLAVRVRCRPFGMLPGYLRAVKLIVESHHDEHAALLAELADICLNSIESLGAVAAMNAWDCVLKKAQQE